MITINEYIKQIGGYETAKNKAAWWLLNHGENWRNIQSAYLLEYRRANNMFEIGDSLVAIDINDPCEEVFKIERKGHDGGFYDTKWRLLNIELFRHANDAEIEANKRARLG